MLRRKSKTKTVLKVRKEPCKLCGTPTTNDNLCFKCGKVICDECAKIYYEERYCPTCFEKIKSLQKMA